jgi:nucleotide-binding universal stress UspA family protein
MTTQLSIDQPAPRTSPVQDVSTRAPTLGTIVAGIDGSGCARRAARWAAMEAIRSHARLRLVHAYSLHVAGFSGYNPYPANMLPELRDDGLALLQDSADRLRADFPGLDISAQQGYGAAAETLRRASEGATLTVVGAHGTNRVAVALGSVAADIAATNPVPVAIIHPGEPPASGPVVVGINDTSTDVATLEFAFQAAASRHATLTAVRSYTRPGLSYLDLLADDTVAPELECQMVSERIARCSRKFPAVAVHQVVLHDRPASALLDYAQFAHLVVVGNRGYGGISGMLVGSVSHELIAYSTAPMVIVRSTSSAT